MASPAARSPHLALNVRRNTLLLAAAMAVYSAVLQLVAAVSSITFVLVTGVQGLLGLGPAIFLVASALAAVPAGRLMDSLGRRPVIIGGYVMATVGCCLTALAAQVASTALLILGFLLTGAANGVALLIRTAAGDMYPPAQRARGISYVLFGSVFGAILGPAVFGPLFSGRELSADALTLPWLAAGGISLIALGLVACVRPDPKRIAELIAPPSDEPASSAPLRDMLVRPGVRPALLAALASFGVMVSVMNLSGYVIVEHHHHGQADVFPVIGAHVLGMYALVLVVGTVIDRIGTSVALAGGLLIMAVSCVGLLWVTSVLGTAILLFGLGVGWNLSFVAATTQLVSATAPSERGRMLGFSDLISALLGAALALLGGYALDSIGVAALALGATVVPGWVTFTGALASARAEQWGTRLFVADGELVGWGGFKGPPVDGAVEIGYEIAAARQGRGLATQAASLLVDEAFAGGASRVLAHTLPEQNASNRVLAKLGFRWDGDAVERGRTVWRFVRERD